MKASMAKELPRSSLQQNGEVEKKKSVVCLTLEHFKKAWNQLSLSLSSKERERYKAMYLIPFLHQLIILFRYAHFLSSRGLDFQDLTGARKHKRATLA